MERPRSVSAADFKGIARTVGLDLSPEELEDLRNGYVYLRDWLARLNRDLEFSDEPAARLKIEEGDDEF